MTLYLNKYNTDLGMLGTKYIDFDVVIDIGANKGDYVKKFRRAFPLAKIYAFEPLPDMFALLQTSLRYKNTEIFNVALADKTGRGKFYYNLDFPDSSSFYKEADFSPQIWNKVVRNIRKITVKTTTLDSVMAGKMKPKDKTLVKIDVEGYEKKVIEGGRKTLRQATACVIEVHFSNWYEGQPSFEEIFQAMKALGYEYRGNWYQAVLSSGAAGYIDAFFVKRDFVKSEEYQRLTK
jgi:FkbM family methyltransferase